MEALSKAFLLFFLLPDWPKLNHLKSRMEYGFSDIFSRHICSTVAETIGVTNYAASFGAKNVQKTTFQAAEMIVGPWSQQISNKKEHWNLPKRLYVMTPSVHSFEKLLHNYLLNTVMLSD